MWLCKGNPLQPLRLNFFGIDFSSNLRSKCPILTFCWQDNRTSKKLSISHKHAPPHSPTQPTLQHCAPTYLPLIICQGDCHLHVAPFCAPLRRWRNVLLVFFEISSQCNHLLFTLLLHLWEREGEVFYMGGGWERRILIPCSEKRSTSRWRQRQKSPKNLAGPQNHYIYGNASNAYTTGYSPRCTLWSYSLVHSKKKLLFRNRTNSGYISRMYFLNCLFYLYVGLKTGLSTIR